MKTKEKLEARKLRKEKGWPLNKIAKHLNVSKGTVSVWVRDVELTEEQKEILQQLNPIFNRQELGNKVKAEKYRKLRLDYQNKGREKVKNGCSDLYKECCMLYWAEGSKGRNIVGFSNTDSHMIKMFTDFLLQEFDVEVQDISVSTHVYLNNGLTFEDIRQYWNNLLGLSDENWRKSQINVLPKSSKKKQVRRHPYGVCRIRLGRTDIVQEIFGAIKEISGIKNEELWL